MKQCWKQCKKIASYQTALQRLVPRTPSWLCLLKKNYNQVNFQTAFKRSKCTLVLLKICLYSHLLLAEVFRSIKTYLWSYQTCIYSLLKPVDSCSQEPKVQKSLPCCLNDSLPVFAAAPHCYHMTSEATAHINRHSSLQYSEVMWLLINLIQQEVLP